MESKEIKVVDKHILTFIEEKNLIESFKWLVDNVSKFFPNADHFEIDFCGGEYDLICLRVFGNEHVIDFRDMRYEFCDIIRLNGYDELYKLLCVFQRRIIKENDYGY